MVIGDPWGRILYLQRGHDPQIENRCSRTSHFYLAYVFMTPEMLMGTRDRWNSRWKIGKCVVVYSTS